MKIKKYSKFILLGIILILTICLMIIFIASRNNGVWNFISGINLKNEPEKDYNFIVEDLFIDQNKLVHSLINVSDAENIDTIELPNGLIISPFGRNNISIDYKFELDKEQNIIVKKRDGTSATETLKYETTDTVNQDNSSLIGYIKNLNTSTKQEISINDENYTINATVLNGDVVLDGITEITGATLNSNIYEFGDSTLDVATDSEDAQNMVILKINGNLKINENITLTSCKSPDGYGGPKGLYIYCTGDIVNDGVISMTARGAKAEGQNIYLWKNMDDTYELVPRDGANGGAATYDSEPGINGDDGQNRQTGGGGSGGTMWAYYSGAGTKGTSFSGGAGGGSAYNNTSAENGYENGGKGGNAAANSKWTWGVGGGAGNPEGISYGSASSPQRGTGGLLVIYGKNIINNNTIEANGSYGGSAYRTGGGGSGGGSINIFCNGEIKKGIVNANGGDGGNAWRVGESSNGGRGGNGSAIIDFILKNRYCIQFIEDN